MNLDLKNKYNYFKEFYIKYKNTLYSEAFGSASSLGVVYNFNYLLDKSGIDMNQYVETIANYGLKYSAYLGVFSLSHYFLTKRDSKKNKSLENYLLKEKKRANMRNFISGGVKLGVFFTTSEILKYCGFENKDAYLYSFIVGGNFEYATKLGLIYRENFNDKKNNRKLKRTKIKKIKV